MTDLEADFAIEKWRADDLAQTVRIKDSVIDELRADFLNIAELCCIATGVNDATELHRTLLAVRELAEANTKGGSGA